MAGYERKNGDWILFPNKSDNPKAPSFKGTILWEGTEYELAGWTKQGQNGKFVTGSMKPKQQRSAAPARQVQDDEDIPFVSIHDSDPMRRFPRA